MMSILNRYILADNLKYIYGILLKFIYDAFETDIVLNTYTKRESESIILVVNSEIYY